MNIRSLIILSLFLMILLPLTGEDLEKDHIMAAMEFPSPELKIGDFFNDPFFAVTIQENGIDKTAVKKTITALENEIRTISDSEKFIKLGNCYKDLKDYDTAVKYYKKYLELNPPSYSTAENYMMILNKGDIYYTLSAIDIESEKNSNLEKALLYLTKTIELNPDNPDQWIKLGDGYLSLGKTTEALYCYNKISEKDGKSFRMYPRIQAAVFQKDYLKLSENMPDSKIKGLSITDGFDFDYIQTAINNSTGDLKESLKLQHYIYLLRLLNLKSESYIIDNPPDIRKSYPLFTKNEKKIIGDAEDFIKNLADKKVSKSKLKYLSGIISYLNSDYKKAVSEFNEILTEEYCKAIHTDILFICMNLIKDDSFNTKQISDLIKFNPLAEDYLVLAGIEFRNKNLPESEMLCSQSLKIKRNFPEAYSGIAVISAMKGNYIYADEMIKEGNSLIRKEKSNRIRLSNQMKINEAAIALLKNEKERAYILLRSVTSVDTNKKASLLYNRYFKKNEKIQN